MKTCLQVMVLGVAGVVAGGMESRAQMTIPEIAPSRPAPAPIFDARGPHAAVATVNGQRITRAQLEAAAQQMMAQQGAAIPEDQRAAAFQQMIQQSLQNLIARELLAQESGKQNIQIPRADMDQAIERVTRSLPPGQTLETALRVQGVTRDQFEANIVRELRIMRLLEQKTADVSGPTSDEIETFYNANAEQFDVPESVRVRHVLVNVLNSDSEDLRKVRRDKAESMRRQIVDGRNFANLAALHSDDASRTQGGEVGPLFRGRVDPDFERAAFALAPDEISPVVETRFGYHVIQGIEKNPARRLPLAEVRDQIANGLTQQRRQVKINEFVEQLSRDAQIEISN